MPNKTTNNRYIAFGVAALLIVIPTVGFIYFATQYNNLRAVATELAQAAAAAQYEEEDYLDNGDEYYNDKGENNNNGTGEINNNDTGDINNNENENYDELTLTEAPEYQLLYPQLYIGHEVGQIIEAEKTIYLTFDDGPTSLTARVLDILRDHDVRATFFVVYRNTAEARALYRRIVDEGHTLGLHSTSHDYAGIYESVESFLSDIATLSYMLEDITGVRPEILRFPGGSINVFNRMVHRELSAEILRRGYVYFDWDVSAVDLSPNATATSVRNNVINGVDGKERAIVLMHDAGNTATASALPGIIEYLQAAGYRFEALDRTIRPVRFNYIPEN